MDAEGEGGFVSLATGEDQGDERKEEKQETAHGGIKSEDGLECTGGGGWAAAGDVHKWDCSMEKDTV
jgi:hypothetical protein